MRSVRAELLLVLTAAIWGLAFVAQRVGAAHVAPSTFNGVRFALGAASLLPLIAVLDRRARANGGSGEVALSSVVEASRAPGAEVSHSWRPHVVPGAVAGALLFTAAYLQQAGMATTTAGKASFLTGMYLVLIPVFGLALGHRTRRATWAGVALAVVGLYLLTIGEAFTVAPGDALELAGAVFWAGHILVIAYYASSARVDPLRLSVVQFVVCAALSLGVALVTEAEPLAGVDAAVVPILYGGILSVGVAYTLQVVAQRDAPPAHAAMIMSTEAVFATIGGAVLLGETMTLRGYAGCGLMLTGILISQATSSEPVVDPAAA